MNVEGGKVLPGQGLTPHGTPADSIVFYVSFNDDEPGNKYKVTVGRYLDMSGISCLSNSGSPSLLSFALLFPDLCMEHQQTGL